MKNLSIILGVLVSIVLLSSCTFNPAFDYETIAPIVSADSVSLVGQDSIRLHGTVVSSGGNSLKYWGISYSQDSVFDMVENQVLFKSDRTELDSLNTFSTLVKGLPEGETYYYKTFAANATTYGNSPSTKFTVPFFGPLEAPCSLTSGIIKLGGDQVVSSTRQGESVAKYGRYGIEVSTGGPFSGYVILFDFPFKPQNGIYNVKEFSSYNRSGGFREAHISARGGVVSGSSLTGGKLYITLTPDGAYLLEFCDIEMSISGNVFDMIGKVEVN